MKLIKQSGKQRRSIGLSALLLVAILIAVPLTAVQGGAISDAPAAPAVDPTIRLSTTPTSGNVGTLFTTRIYADNITNASGLGNWQASINYAPAVLAVDSVAFGADLASTGRTVGNVGPNYTTGKVTLGQFSFGTQNGPTGSNLLLATIVWRGVAGGVSDLDLNQSQLLDINANPLTPLIQVDNQVTVVGGPTSTNTPTPTLSLIHISEPTRPY